MAPRPPPPADGLVPIWATDWEHCIKPGANYALCCRFADQIHAWHLFVKVNRTAEGAPRVDFVAFGADGFAPWAESAIRAGHIIVRRNERLELLDQSAAPPTHWNRDYLSGFIGVRGDYGLRDTVLTHGVSYLADVEPQTVFQAHLKSLAGEGYESVHTELARLHGLGWYSLTPMRRPDSKLDLPCQPLRFVGQSAVPRARSNRWRRVVDSWQPRRKRFTRGARDMVISLAAACAVGQSPSAHPARGCRPL